MQRIINSEDIRRANDIERCQMMLAIIRKEAIFIKE